MGGTISAGTAVLGLHLLLLCTAGMPGAADSSAASVHPGLPSSRRALPGRSLRGGSADELQKWAQKAQERLIAHLPDDGDTEISLTDTTSGESASDSDAAWDRNAARRHLIGIETMLLTQVTNQPRHLARIRRHTPLKCVVGKIDPANAAEIHHTIAV